MKFRILHCITDLSPDGAQRALLRLATKMDKERFEGHIVSLMPNGALEPQFREAGFGITSLRMRKGVPDPLAVFGLVRAIRRINPHIIQGWMYHANFAVTISQMFSGSKAVQMWNMRRCLYDEPGDAKLKRLIVRAGGPLSRFPTKIIHCVGISADQHKAIGYDFSKRVIIPNGFDTDKFSPREASRESLRKELGISGDRRVVGIVGRYHPQKDFPTFLKAVRIVVDTFSNVTFVMVGRDLDEKNAELAAAIENLGIRRNIALLGQRNNISEVMAGFDILCSSSANEGFANVVGEGMSCGLPCVVTDAGASRELVEGIGIVADRYDSDGLANGLLAMLSFDQAELIRKGLEGRQRILQKYSLDGMVRAYENLYQEYAQQVAPVIE